MASVKDRKTSQVLQDLDLAQSKIPKLGSEPGAASRLRPMGTVLWFTNQFRVQVSPYKSTPHRPPHQGLIARACLFGLIDVAHWLSNSLQLVSSQEQRMNGMFPAWGGGGEAWAWEEPQSQHS